MCQAVPLVIVLFYHLSVSPSDVFSELPTLNTSKACRPGGICPRHLKEGAAELAKPWPPCVISHCLIVFSFLIGSVQTSYLYLRKEINILFVIISQLV